MSLRVPRLSFTLGLWLLCLLLAAPLGAQQPPTDPTRVPTDTAPSALPIQGQQPAAELEQPTGMQARIDRAMGQVNSLVARFFFADVLFWDDRATLPLVVLWLVLGAIYFTFRMGFINISGFGHAIAVTRGKYDDPNSTGEVSHFRALTAALSATVGLGNIAGVAIAVSIGGPGATFWMILAGILGMSTKFAECTLGQQYRQVRPDGRIMGGAMFYLSNGLAELGWSRLGKFLAVFFAILCIGGSLAGGNAFQVNQSMNAIQETIPALANFNWVYGLVMTFFVGIVIIGGIKSIAAVAARVVPTMVVIYVLACLYILFAEFGQIPAAFATIFREAFMPSAAYGGFIGTLVMGFQRAAFSNEAGAGSAAIAHSAARTPYPVREGYVALLEPFIDTVVVCTMTALVIVITGAYANPAYETIIQARAGAALTSRAMAEHLTWFPYVLSVAVLLFAYSTMISWSYYGERCWAYLFGDHSSMSYRVLFLLFVFLGSIITAINVLDFGDLMILGMAFPNILGVVLLSGKVKRELDDYRRRLKSGEIKTAAERVRTTI
ncbi:MAG TPA: alanine/glycine:cation symporter family protein [Gemmatimonadaceae bacterium]|nr:alanine/glycine:cation symporter family protein [Gemmatimonadaceae bacterium]